MAKSVLGSDPFQQIESQTGSQKKSAGDEKKESAKKPAASKAEKKKKPTKPAKAAKQPDGDSKTSKKPVKKATPKKAAPKKTAAKKPTASKTASKPAAAKKTAMKKTTTKKAPTKAAAKSTPAKKAAKQSAKSTGTASKTAAAVKPASKKTAKTKTAIADTPKQVKQTPAPKKAVARKKTVAQKKDATPKMRPSMAIGGGDPDLLKLLRPEGFELGQEYGFDPGYSKHIQPLIQFLYRFYYRVTVLGAENIPQQGRAVLVSNHAGILPFDSLMIRNAVRWECKRNVWPLIEDYFYYAPILGPILNRFGMVRACQENAQRLLLEDELTCVFPEGIKGVVKPYRNRYRLQRFGRGGFVKLCLVTDSPVIPMVVVGSEETHPVMANLGGLAKSLGLPFLPITPQFPWLGPFGLLPLPSKWTIVFGEPIFINQFGPEAATDRVVVNRLSNEVRNRIQKMLDEQLEQRHSSWR